MKLDPANRDWQLGFTTQLVVLGNACEAARRWAEALTQFRRVWQFSEQQEAAAQEYPDWLANWKSSLTAGERINRRLAADSSVPPDQAQLHREEAERLLAQRNTRFP